MNAEPSVFGNGMYEKRKVVYPKAVDGFYRRLKWVVMAVTLAIYYITPWIRWDRGPYAPNQAVLIDLAHRRFYMFAIEIWPHEFYYVVGLLIMAGVGLFLVTSMFGRAWCGYSCPQTVWTDLFQHIDRLIDGDRNAQIKLAKAPWGAAKIGRRLIKWSIYLAISLLTGGAWILYFADAPTLIPQFWQGHAAPVAYATVAILTMTTFVLGGFVREQLCIYMCPWPRIQTAMLDEKSLIVTYKDWRGEPRTHGLKKAAEAGEKTGDCIDCLQCNAVCPTGIDIRTGPQIGCITCGLCIDACDQVMEQVGRPRGLIDYCTLEDAAVEKAGQPSKTIIQTLKHPRPIIYFSLWSAVGVAMLFSLGQRSRLDIAVQQDRNPIYVRLSDGAIRNAYTIKIRNMESRPRDIVLSFSGLPGGKVWSDTGDRSEASDHLVTRVAADSVEKRRIFVVAPADGPERSEFTVAARGAVPVKAGHERGDSEEMTFKRPEAPQ